ncbi:osmoprotectant ABC transporter substrate-binding protein [Levilactobacillus brevis]|uniref:osmoprotectant ABC transporter substrate-binding protein n=1 Tax=Levilactobacillus brevis TaxID=1580 RepID=UPI000B3E5D9F|nr:osmoprotectant ABC transporter substrate-binding protein [Levilactobacillus brevis]ARW49789.1 Glycine betaine/carnitine/choline-binding protein OpuCC [Levilactobacillus brevis]MCM6798463.1 osmoprotectant ABC transporter substrate-binding protein [Levilactobacillus brevis]MCM6800590.1 osmoprotectant ABC transporter substrate-binding protein [Levilactobacillus brevis]MCM6806072.1 osmoprotectant ABC transporter substrate-binding protein [Levilactobacillus brevis]MCM6808752.1 osmoprotectant ABC
MRKHLRKWLAGLLAAVILLPLGGCSLPGLAGSGNDTIRIASQNTTEQQIMAYMIAGMIEHDTNLKTSIINNLGSGNVSFNALKNGNADISAIRFYGTDLTTILNEKFERDPAKVKATVTKGFQDRYHMTYFKTYGFADTYAWMVTQKYAKQHHLKTVSDMKKLAPKMKVGIDQIWQNRQGDGYPAFQKMYGYSFGTVYPMQTGLLYDALSANKMDAILGYSTDGRVASYHLKLLKDDKHFFPPYDASPVATNAILKKHPELKPVLEKLEGKISLKTMQELNYKVDDELEEPQTVAMNYLKQHHYFEGGNN